MRHRKKKKHTANSIAVPAACFFHVTVMVEARIQGTSPLLLLIHVSYTYSTVNHSKSGIYLLQWSTPFPAGNRTSCFWRLTEDSSLVTPKSKLPCSASVCGGTASGTTTPSEQDSRKDAETRDRMRVCYASLVYSIWYIYSLFTSSSRGSHLQTCTAVTSGG